MQFLPNVVMLLDCELPMQTKKKNCLTSEILLTRKLSFITPIKQKIKRNRNGNKIRYEWNLSYALLHLAKSSILFCLNDGHTYIYLHMCCSKFIYQSTYICHNWHLRYINLGKWFRKTKHSPSLFSKLMLYQLCGR